MEVLIVNLVFLALTILIIRYKTYKKPSFLIYWGAIIIFICPVNYIYFGGVTYKHFGEEATTLYEILSVISIISIYLFFGFNLLWESRKKSKIDVTVCKSNIVDYFSIFIFILSMMYFLFYFKHWPLLDAFSGVIEARPDIVKGIFKGYFMMSIIYQVILPSILFYYWQSKQLNKKLFYLLFFTVSFFIIIGGNKGIYLYFIMFIFITIIKKVNVKLIFISLLSMVFLYAVMKGVTLDYATFKDYLLESIFRRVFITQGMGIPNSIQMMLNGFDFSLYNSHDMKFVIFEYIYGYSPGSMPLYFTGELFIRYGFFSVIVFSFFFSFFGSLISFKCESYGYYSINWCLYYSLYVFVMSGVSLSNFYRLIVIFIMIVFFVIFTKIIIVKQRGSNGNCINNNTKL